VNERLAWLGNNRQERYFSLFVLAFLGSYMVLPTSKMVNNFYYVFLAIPAFFALVLSKWRDFVNKPGACGFLIFLAWLVVPGISSGDAQFFRHLLYVLLFVATLMVLVNPKPFHDPRFFRALFWTVCIYVIGSALYYWVSGLSPVGLRIKPLARMMEPTYSGMWVAACLALVAPAWLAERRFVEGALGLLLTVFCVTFILQSRSGLVGIVLVFLFFAGKTAVADKRTAVTIALLFLVGFGVLWLFKEAPGIRRIFEDRDTGRLEMWSVLLNDWKNCGYWSGCGLDYVCKGTITARNNEVIAHPHNIYLSVGIYTGMVSLVIFVAWLARVIWLAIRNHSAWGLYLAVAAVTLLFDGGLIVGNPDELWILVLLPAGLICANHSRAAATFSYGGGR
jgi:hypothetical protein